MALIIDASGKYLSRTTNLPSMDVTDPGITMCFWAQYVSANAFDKEYTLSLGYGSDENNTLGGYDPYGGDFAVRWGDTPQGGIGTQPTNGVWYWFALGADMTYSSVTPVGSSPTWDLGTDSITGTPTSLVFGTHFWGPTTMWCNCRLLAVKMWAGTLTRAQLEAERFWYEPQVTSGVHAWYPLISDATDHSANAYDMTPTGSPSYGDYTPAGMNALQGTGDPGQIDSVISL